MQREIYFSPKCKLELGRSVTVKLSRMKPTQFKFERNPYRKKILNELAEI